MNDKIVLSQVLPITMLFWLGTINAAYGFLRETHDRKYLKNMFGQYVPPQIVDEMNKAPDASYGFDGESRQMRFPSIRALASTVVLSLALVACDDDGGTGPLVPGAPTGVTAVANGTTVTVSFTAGANADSHRVVLTNATEADLPPAVVKLPVKPV